MPSANGSELVMFGRFFKAFSVSVVKMVNFAVSLEAIVSCAAADNQVCLAFVL